DCCARLTCGEERLLNVARRCNSAELRMKMHRYSNQSIAWNDLSKPIVSTILTVLLPAGLLSPGSCFGTDEFKIVRKPEPASYAPLYTGNREPLSHSHFIKLPIGSITPKGWLRHQLELERDGMTGHLEEISKWCKFEGNAWASPDGEGHSGWEELPYWLKGYGDLGYVLKDEVVIKNARKWIDAVLSSQE